MNWLIIGVGLALLSIGVLLPLLFIRANSVQRNSFSAFFHYVKIIVFHPAERLMKRTARRLISSSSYHDLYPTFLPLLEQLLLFRRKLRNELPFFFRCRSDMMSIGQEIVDAGDYSASALLKILLHHDSKSLLPSELHHFPLLVGLTQYNQLTLVLKTMLRDHQEKNSAARIARKLKRSRNFRRTLERTHLHSAGIAELLMILQTNGQHTPLKELDDWFEQRHTSAQEVSQQSIDRQLRHAEEIRRAVACFDALSRLDWLPHCEQADRMHALLLEDPSGLYPRMTTDSRYHLRRQIEAFCCAIMNSPEQTLELALRLSHEAETRSTESYIGYWFQDEAGMKVLCKALGVKRGKLHRTFAFGQGRIRRAWLWAGGVIAGFLFLQAGNPMWMLPFFTITAGSLLRGISWHAAAPLPALDTHKLPEKLRTLVVLPAVLNNPQEAIRMVRRLKILRHSFPDDGVAFLLLGDFGDSMTLAGSQDGAIVQAASTAVSAIADERCMYLHRSRKWDGERHICHARCGQMGAIEDICRLIAQGECESEIVYASVEPASFERAYDYIFVLSPDATPASGMLQALIQHMAHPLCGRFPIPGGWRGYSVLSPAGSSLYDGIGLIRPDAFLEGIDGMADLARDQNEILGELAGHAAIAQARMLRPRQALTLEARCHMTYLAWSVVRWQLPWVKTPSGLVRNPLGGQSRFRFREKLRNTLLPVAQCGLLLWGILTGQWLLLLLSLLAGIVKSFPHNRKDMLRIVGRLALLPGDAASAICGIIGALRNRQRASSVLTTWLIWSQAIFATILAALGIALPGAGLPALALGILFACFPLAHRLEFAGLSTSNGLSDEHTLHLWEASERTWRFFFEQPDLGHCPLPPCDVQFNPDTGPSDLTSPEAIGAALLACVCAKDMGFIRADQAALRIRILRRSLADLPMPFGLPCRRYDRHNGTVQDPRCETAGVGFLLCALMTTAQALRCWLPEMSEDYRDLSAELIQTVSACDVLSLYDSQARLFYQYLDENRQGHGCISCFTDEAILLSVAACSMGVIGPEHFEQLHHTCIWLRGREVPLSHSGNASAYLLPGLFLPLDPLPAQNYASIMAQQEERGLFGKDVCACCRFDPSLRYLHGRFGLSEAALAQTSDAPVYAPYAASLCLPALPRAAGDALLRFQSEGAYGPMGYCDAVDYTQNGAVVGLYDTYHQGIFLMAAAHMLADTPIQRYFCMQPGVEACLPLLEYPSKPLILSLLPQLPFKYREHQVRRRIIDTSLFPPQKHLLGTADFHVVTDAHGFCTMYDQAIPLLASGNHDLSGGIRFYLADEGRTYWLGDPALPGEVVFSDGEAVVSQTCGSLKAELVCMADTVRSRAMHVLTITNLSTRDRVIDAADLLLPDLGVHAGTLEVHRTDKQLISLHARGTDRTLYHAVSSTVSPLSLTVCTELTGFVGRGRSWHYPAALEGSPQDRLIPLEDACLSFRARLALGGRSQITLWFTTSLQLTPVPQWHELSGLRRLAALQHAAIREAAHMDEVQISCAEQLVGALDDASGLLLRLESSSGVKQLMELAALMGWMQLHGMMVKLLVICNQERHCEAEAALRASPVEALIEFSDHMPDSSARYVVLNDSEPLSEQAERLYFKHMPASAQFGQPKPALLPRTELIQRSSYGGFDPESGAYVIELESGMMTPSPWSNLHHSRHYQEKVNESGFDEPVHENLWLQMADGTIFSPWDIALPRRIRMEPGMTIWEAWTDKFDIRLCAAALPGHRCGFRVLRIRNATDDPISMQIKVAAFFPEQPALDIAPGLVIADSSGGHYETFLAGESWEACRARYSPSQRPDVPPPDGDHADGKLALLQRTLILPANSSGDAVWLSGKARSADDIMRALNFVGQSGAAAILHQVRSSWAQRLDGIRISTPEATQDLLMNNMLPVQAYQAESCHGIPALIYLCPGDAKWQLLQYARAAHTHAQWAQYALYLAAYVSCTQDKSILDVFLPQHGTSLLEHCTHMLLTLPVDQRGLPAEEDQAYLCMLFSSAANALDRLRPADALTEFARRLSNAGDTYLWEECCYGSPLRLDVQALAVLAYGSNFRTRQAMRTAWSTLYDPEHGLIRHQEPTDAAKLPGLPENGGMQTCSAALALHALIRTGQTSEAHELLRALNPIHHCDDALRMSRFREAPYRLHGGMQAFPMEAGRAIPKGGNKAAGLLYAIILKDILGLHREGSRLRLHPHVPADWNDYTLTLREGASTWHISMERRIKCLTIDGQETADHSFQIVDDGRIHQVRVPLV